MGLFSRSVLIALSLDKDWQGVCTAGSLPHQRGEEELTTVARSPCLLGYGESPREE